MIRYLRVAAVLAGLLSVPAEAPADDDNIYDQFAWKTKGADGDDTFAWPYYYHGTAGFYPPPFDTDRRATDTWFSTPYHYNPYDSPFFPPYWKATTNYGYYGFNSGTFYAPYSMHTGLSIGPSSGSRILYPITGY